MMCVFVATEPVGEAVPDCTVHQKHTSPGDHVPVSFTSTTAHCLSLWMAASLYIWISSMSKKFRKVGFFLQINQGLFLWSKKYQPDTLLQSVHAPLFMRYTIMVTRWGISEYLFLQIDCHWLGGGISSAGAVPQPKEVRLLTFFENACIIQYCMYVWRVHVYCVYVCIGRMWRGVWVLLRSNRPSYSTWWYCRS